MNEIQYRSFYDAVGERNGWDFSRLSYSVEGEMVELFELAKAKLTSNDILLDIGTGGGERILELANQALLTVGIDTSPSMIRTAIHNARQHQPSNTRFLEMDAKDIQFPNQFFNIVTCRQAPFHPSELVRVMKNGGIFMTQQVMANDKLNLKQAFGRGQDYGVDASVQTQLYCDQLREAGFSTVESITYNVTEYYHSAEDLIFLLKHTPIIDNFGQHPQDFKILEQFITNQQCEQGIKTNSARLFINAVK